ncbi:MAG: NADH-quinone oxidoreductase subunit J [Phycisphaerales bacterium]
MSDLVQPILLYIGCALGAIGVMLALPRRGASPQVIGGLITAAAIGAIFLALGLGVARSAGVDRLPNINFYVFSVIAIGAALRVISHPRPVYAALYFILTILASCGLYVILAAEFMAFALVIVYAGAILITYLFVIMLATEAPTEEEAEALQPYDKFSREPIAATVAGFVLLATLTTLLAQGSRDLKAPALADAHVEMTGVSFSPGSEQSGDTGDRRVELPSVAATLTSDRAVAGRLHLAIAGKTWDLDEHSLETGMRVSLVPGVNTFGIPVADVTPTQGQSIDAWFMPDPVGDMALAAKMPGRLERALREARDPDEPTRPLIHEDEELASIDAARRVAVLRTVLDSPQGNNSSRLGSTRTVEFPADLEIYNVEGVAFTLLDKHPGAIEIAGVILLMAMLGAVVLARKKVEMDDAAKLAAQQRHLVTVIEAGPIAGRDRMNGAVHTAGASASAPGGRS